jgi:hypothetical protein
MPGSWLPGTIRVCAGQGSVAAPTGKKQRAHPPLLPNHHGELAARSSNLPGEEWLLDNDYLIQEQIKLAQAHLSPGYSRGLPRLTAGPREGFPRVYDIVMEVVLHSDGQVSHERLSRFIGAYQEVHPLILGELWAVPIVLRLSLIEKLRLAAQRVAWRSNQRDAALYWADRFLKTVETNPRMLVTTLGDFVRSAPSLTPAFISELVAHIDGVDPALGMVLNWLQEELSNRGLSIERAQKSEPQAQAANLVTISNCITSLHNMASIDWADFVESASEVETILRRDPVGVYPQMEFLSRNRYRTRVEELARLCRKSERDVAEAAVNLAGGAGGQIRTVTKATWAISCSMPVVTNWKPGSAASCRRTGSLAAG